MISVVIFLLFSLSTLNFTIANIYFICKLSEKILNEISVIQICPVIDNSKYFTE